MASPQNRVEGEREQAERIAAQIQEGVTLPDYPELLILARVFAAAQEENEYATERAGILATAVGLARVNLSSGEPDRAKERLADAAAKTGKLLRDRLIAQGNEPEKVDAFLGRAATHEDRERE